MSALEINLSYNQILSLVKQLSIKQKIKLTKELEKESINSKLSELLTSFKTDELDEETIQKEVEIVRQKMYDEKK